MKTAPAGKNKTCVLMTYINPVCLVPPQGSPLSLQEEGRGGGELGERRAKLKEPENATEPGNE